MKILAYLRVSTDQQAESGAGLAAQLDACNKWAADNKRIISKIYTDDGISGSAPLDQRPALMELINDLKKGDIILVAKRDRLARGKVMGFLDWMIVEKNKARILSCVGEGTDGEKDDPMSYMLQGMTDLFAGFERLLIKSRTKAALRAKKARGERVGHIPFGYQLAQDGKQLVVNESEQDILRQMRELQSEGLSIRKIATELNQRKAFNRGNSQWNNASVHRMLKAAA